MMFGFALRRLALIGPGKAPAEVTFTRGLNVIAGPSDTGKSFIAQCLDYALGGGDLPKEIPEAEGYSSVILEIEDNSNHRVYSLERSLRGGEILCKTDGQPERVLAAKHQGGKEDTVSQFLLDLSGLGTKKVRTNEQGKTRPLSFRRAGVRSWESRGQVLYCHIVLDLNAPWRAGVRSCIATLSWTSMHHVSIQDLTPALAALGKEVSPPESNHALAHATAGLGAMLQYKT